MEQKLECPLSCCLVIGREKKLTLISLKISNLHPLLVSVMFYCSQTIFVDFLEFSLKRRHLKNLKKYANNFTKNKNVIYKIASLFLQLSFCNAI